MPAASNNPKNPDTVRANVAAALAEDIGSGDLTAALVPADQLLSTRVIARESGILCGQAWFDEVFRQLDPAIRIDWHISDGERLTPDDSVCIVSGPSRPILSGERSALNFLQLLSATATAAAAYAQAVAAYPTRILDTRKTIPGLRMAQKYAVRTGGADNHRIGLFDAVLIKENHIHACGSIAKAIATARHSSGNALVEVEAENLDEVEEAINAGADRILLDNLSVPDLKAAVAARNDAGSDIELEASGGITLENAAAIAAAGVDYISVGDLTKNLQALDLSMRYND